MPSSSLIDPLGRTIILHASTWSIHIVQGHPDLSDLRHLVESAIVNPFIITHSRSDLACRLYHGPGPRRSVTIRVAVDVVRGLVKTAHIIRKVSATETVKWSLQTP